MRICTARQCCGIVLAGVVVAPATAATEVAPYLQEITVTASQPERLLLQVGSSVSVLTGDDLRQLKRQDLAEALRVLPGVTVARQGGTGALASVRVRGEEGYRTRLIMDGIPLSDVSAPQAVPRFEWMIGNQLDRVEVLRGPQGLLYGADAGGVISVFSRQAQQPFEADVTMEGGGLQSYLMDANIRGRHQSMRYSLTATDFATSGFNARLDDLIGERDGAQSTTWHGTLGMDIAERQQVHWVYRHVDSLAEYDQCFDDQGRSDLCTTHNALRAGRGAWRYTGSKQSHELAYVRTDMDQRDMVAGQTQVADKTSELSTWSYQGAHRFGTPLTFTWGVDHREEVYQDRQYGGEGQLWQRGAYFEGLVSITDRFHYNLGIRRDHHEDFGGHTNYRFSAAYLIPLGGESLKLKGAWGTGFRAPSLYESGNALEGIPLKEETSEGMELGVAWLAAAGTLEAVAFVTDVADRIEYDLEEGGYRQVSAVGRSQGLELSVHRDLWRYITLSAQYTFNQTFVDKDADELQQRPQRPRHSYALGLASRWMKDRLSLNAHYRGSYRSIDTAGEALNNYQVLDFNAGWQVDESLQYYVRVRNAMDAEYQEIRNYHSAPRTFYVGVKLAF